MQAEIVKHLKREVQDTFGRKILIAKDCSELSDAVNSRTGIRIHPHTLRRIFGLVKTPFHPSTSTLSVLAQYSGYNSIQDLPDKYNDDDDRSIPEIHVIQYFVSLFENQSISKASMQAHIEQIITFLNRHPGLARKLQKQIAKTKRLFMASHDKWPVRGSVIWELCPRDGLRFRPSPLP